MRKLIIYTGNFSEPNQNAAGKRVFGVSRILENLGYDVLLLGKAKSQAAAEKVYNDHITFISYPGYGRVKYNEYFKFLKNHIDINKEKLSCIIRYGSPGLSLFDYKLISFAHDNGIVVVADVVDWLNADGGNLVFNTLKSTDTFFEKAVFNSMSDGIIAISSYLSDYYSKKGKKVVTIPPVVEKYTRNVAVNKPIKIIYAGSPFRLGTTVKNVHKIKDRLDLAIEALASLYLDGKIDLSFCIYGITKEQYLIAFPHHNDLIEKSSEVVHFKGLQPMETIQNEISKADFSILLREVNRGTSAGFPTKVVEAMSCGTPMITTKTSDLPQYITSGDNGFFVDIDDIEELKRQLQSILSLSTNDLLHIKEKCFNGRQFLPQEFEKDLGDFIKSLE